MSKKPIEDFIPIADEGAIELIFCELFRSDGEPKWKQMGEFLDGVEAPDDSFIKAVELAAEGKPYPPKWAGIPPEQRSSWVERIARQMLTRKPPLPNQRLKAACWLLDAYIHSGGNIPKGCSEGKTNIRRLKIQNPNLSKEELEQAHKESGLGETALGYAREFCDEFEGLTLEDGRKKSV